jgi:hypothetical protein
MERISPPAARAPGWAGEERLAARPNSRHRHPAAVLGTLMKTEWILLFGCAAVCAIAVAIAYALD